MLVYTLSGVIVCSLQGSHGGLPLRHQFHKTIVGNTPACSSPNNPGSIRCFRFSKGEGRRSQGEGKA